MSLDPFEIAGDIIKAGGDVIDAAVDTADDITKALGLPPIASDVKDAIVDLVKGPLRDFANTDVGRMVLRAFATGLYYQLGPILGPQFAAVAFAVPGVLRGEKFDQAWTTEFIWRVTTTATILGGMYLDDANADFQTQSQHIDLSQLPTTDQLGENLMQVVSLAKQFQDAPFFTSLDVMNFPYNEYADQLGMRADRVMQALALAKRDDRALASFCTDIASGRVNLCK